MNLKFIIIHMKSYIKCKSWILILWFTCLNNKNIFEIRIDKHDECANNGNRYPILYYPST